MKSLNRGLIANVLFAVVVLLSIAANIFVAVLSIFGVEINIVANMLLSQAIIFVPGIIAYICLSKDKEAAKPYRKIKPVTILLLIVVTCLLIPMMTSVNVLSQVFTSNEAMKISGDVVDLPFPLMILIMGFVGPFCEEFVFRGVIYKSLKDGSKRIWLSAIVSGLFFGFMHMNLNQFCYAFFLGVCFAIMNELLDSTWASFISHVFINSYNVFLIYASDKLINANTNGQNGIYDIYQSEILNMENGVMSRITILVLGLILIIPGLTGIVLAGYLLYGICCIENKKERFKAVFARNKKDSEPMLKGKVLYAPGYAAMAICAFVIFILSPLTELIRNIIVIFTK